MVIADQPVDTLEPLAPVFPSDESLGALFDAHRQSAFNLAYRLVRRPEDAADAVQDAFVLAMRATRSDTAALRDASRFRPWLLKIVANVALGQLRRKRSDLTASLDALALDPADTRGDQPLAAAVRRERRGDVLHALLVLPDEQRAALTLREYQGLSYDEIGELLGLERAATTALLYRARCAFRRAYQGLVSRAGPVGCSELAPLISAMLDAELDVSTWRHVEQHVAGCRSCRLELRQLRGARRLLGTIPLVAPPAGWSWASTLNAARTAGGVGAASPATQTAVLGPVLTSGAVVGATSALPGASFGGLFTSIGGLVSGKLTGMGLIVGLSLSVVVGAPSHHRTSTQVAHAVTSPPSIIESGLPGDDTSRDAPVAPAQASTEPGSEPVVPSAESIAPSIDLPAEASRTVASIPVLVPSESLAPTAASSATDTMQPADSVASQPPDHGAVPHTTAESPAAAAPSAAESTQPLTDGPGTDQPASVVAAPGQSSAGPALTELPPIDPPPLEAPPVDPPPVDVPVAGLPPVDVPPIDLPTADLPPADLPSVDLTVIDVPPVDQPDIALPAIDLGSIDVPAADLLPTDVQSVGDLAEELPELELPPVDLPVAAPPIVERPLDQVKGVAAQEKPGAGLDLQTFSSGAPPGFSPQPGSSVVDASPSTVGDGESQGDGRPVDVDVTDASPTINDGGANNLVDASIDVGTAAAGSRDGNVLSVSTNADATNSSTDGVVSVGVEGSAGSGSLVESSTSLSVSVDGGSNGSNSGAVSVSVSMDSSSNDSGSSSSSNNDSNSGSMSVSVSVDNSSSGGDNNGSNSDSGTSVSVGGISVSLP